MKHSTCNRSVGRITRQIRADRALDLLAQKAGKGQGLVEYALIIVLISIVSIVIMTTLGGSITSVFSTANGALVSP